MYSEELLEVEHSIRVGWGSRYTSFNVPCGSNMYGYALCSKNGKIYHKGVLRNYDKSRELYENDVIGCYIHIPNNTETYSLIQPSINLRSRTNYNSKQKKILPNSHNIFPDEKKNARNNDLLFPYIEDPRMNTKLWPWISRVVVEGSYIKFSLNGYDLGIAFSGLHKAEYHPCVSAYMGGSASINFGPNFKYKPSSFTYSSSSSSIIRASGACEAVTFKDACLMNPPRFPCREDLVKCYVLSNEWVDELNDHGEVVKRRKTYAEVEGLVTMP